MSKLAQQTKEKASQHDEMNGKNALDTNHIGNMLKLINKPSFSALSTAGSAAADVAISMSSSVNGHIHSMLRTLHEAGELYATNAKSQADTAMSMLSICLNSGVSLATKASEELMSATETLIENITAMNFTNSKSDK